MSISNVVMLNGLSHPCSQCHSRDGCLAAGVPVAELRRFERIVTQRKPLRRDAVLFKQRDRLSSLFVVRSGSFKSCGYAENGHSQINAFYTPGQIVGLDAISLRRHPNTAMALETSAVCEVSFAPLMDLAHQFEGLQRLLLRMLSRELNTEERYVRVVADLGADAKLAYFLLDLAARNQRRGYSGTQFRLPMRQSDIGNFLGLAVETVSRQFSRFQRDGLIVIKDSTVKILKPDAFNQVAGEISTQSRRRYV